MLADRQRDVLLTARHLKSRLLRQWGRTMTGWERRSPKTYLPAKQVYHRLRPGKHESMDEQTEPRADGSVVTLDGVCIRLHERLSSKQVKKLTSGRHTQHERALVLDHLHTDDVVMELGGGIGMLSAAIALKIGGEQVHSYEANPELEPLIRDNYALNNVQPHMKLCMLGREAGTRTFHVSRHFSRSNAHAPDENTHPVEVPVEPLNDEIARLQPTVLILDIQGGEGEILDFADLGGIRLLLVEMHPDILGIRRVLRLRRRLREAGFEELHGAGQSFLYRRAIQTERQSPSENVKP